ncbi:MAG: TonB-dependent receptor [Prolixibacteraceae bacterium]|nr:TonB-dependent receptor [Prolixibacteraceae bacterium]
MKSRLSNLCGHFHFRKWSDRPYSVFNTLKRIVHISSLICCYVFLLPTMEVEAQEIIKQNNASEEEPQEDIPEVVVSAKRVPVLLSDVNRSITVIDRKEIQLAAVQSIQDLLEYAMSVDFRQRGGMGVQTDMSIRGGSSEQVAVLINGMCINDPQTGHNTLNLPIPLDAVKRIEILNGASSVNYGVNAFTGAINIITDADDVSSVSVDINSGSYGFMKTGVSASLASNKMTHFVSASHKKSDGYIDNTDFKISNLYYSGKVKFKESDLRGQIGYVDNAFGANSFYTPKYPDQYEHVKTSFASLQWKNNGFLHLSPSVYYRRGVDHFKLYRDRTVAPSWYKTDNYHRTDVIGANVDGWFEWALGKTSLGYNFRSEAILSNKLGEQRDHSKSIPGVEEASYTHGHERQNHSAFLSHDVKMGNWDFSLSYMVIKNSDLKENFFHAPGLDLGWRISENFRWVASVNKALRMPTYTDLYYDSPTSKGNINLNPEEAWTFETGVKYYNHNWKSNINVFHRKGSNIIDWVAASDQESKVYVATNITDLNIYGFEGNMEYQFDDSFIQKVKMNFSFLNQDQKKIDGFDSSYALDYLKAKVDFGITHKLVDKFVADWLVTYQDRNGDYMAYDIQTGKMWQTACDPFVLANVRVSYIDKQFRAYMEISNLFDTSYVDLGNVEQPGIWLKLGLKYRFNL